MIEEISTRAADDSLSAQANEGAGRRVLSKHAHPPPFDEPRAPMIAPSTASAIVMWCFALFLIGCGAPSRHPADSDYKPVGAKWPQEDISVFDRLLRSTQSAVSMDEQKVIVKVYFGTNRMVQQSEDGLRTKSDDIAPMTYGWIDVSIPVGRHKVGEIERPYFNFTVADPKYYFVVGKEAILKHEDFISLLGNHVATSKAKKAFVFVHGFNVEFQDAVFRTAQIAWDLRFDGPAILFCWPSLGREDGYFADIENMRLSKPQLETFLIDVATQTGADSIYLIAHSMGNQGLTEAFIEAAKVSDGVRKRIQELILAAPDIDARVFAQEIAPKLAAIGTPSTLYANAGDVALKLAKKARKDYPRIGDTSDGIVVVKGIETIDASEVATDIGLVHSYIFDTDTILGDMHSLITARQRAKERFGLEVRSTKDGLYWKVVRRRQPLTWAIVLLIASVIALTGFLLYRRWNA